MYSQPGPGAQGLTPLGIAWVKDLGDSESAGGEGGTSQQPAGVRIPTGSVVCKVQEGGDNGPGRLLTKSHCLTDDNDKLRAINKQLKTE